MKMNDLGVSPFIETSIWKLTTLELTAATGDVKCPATRHPGKWHRSGWTSATCPGTLWI